MLTPSVAVWLLSAALSVGYGEAVATLLSELAELLAQANAPNAEGAIGRNRPDYFHVRFQRGMHHVADFGLATRNVAVMERFVRAVEYSLARQLPSGDFDLVIPTRFAGKGQPSKADRASGVAFYCSSLGLGLYGCRTSAWFRSSPECRSLRQRLDRLEHKLAPTLAYLKRERNLLEVVDGQAPNRLLFDALAFITLGRLTADAEGVILGREFASRALRMTDAEGGYFIEGGGYDSSYNGVACALALRLLLLGERRERLESIGRAAVRWQTGRVLESGEITTEGNTRVHPGAKGESFLGRKKGVDVAHTLSTFMLASTHFRQATHRKLALRVARHYRPR